MYVCGPALSSACVTSRQVKGLTTAVTVGNKLCHVHVEIIPEQNALKSKDISTGGEVMSTIKVAYFSGTRCTCIDAV